MGNLSYRLGAGMLLPPIRRRGSPAVLADRVAEAIASPGGWCLPTEGGSFAPGQPCRLRCRVSPRSPAALQQAAEHPQRRPRACWCWVGDTDRGAVLVQLRGHLKRQGSRLLLIGHATLRSLEEQHEP